MPPPSSATRFAFAGPSTNSGTNASGTPAASAISVEPEPPWPDHRRRLRHHGRLRHPALHPHRRRQRAELGRVAAVADRDQRADRQLAERLGGAAVDAGEVVRGRRLRAEGHVDERRRRVAPVRQRGGMPRRGVAEAQHRRVLDGAARRRRREGQHGRPADRGCLGVRREADLRAQGVERGHRDADQPPVGVRARVEVDPDAHLRDAVPLGGQRRRELERLAHDDVGPPGLDRGEHPGQRRPRVEPDEQLLHDRRHARRGGGRPDRRPRPLRVRARRLADGERTGGPRAARAARPSPARRRGRRDPRPRRRARTGPGGRRGRAPRVVANRKRMTRSTDASRPRAVIFPLHRGARPLTVRRRYSRAAAWSSTIRRCTGVSGGDSPRSSAAAAWSTSARSRSGSSRRAAGRPPRRSRCHMRRPCHRG